MGLITVTIKETFEQWRVKFNALSVTIGDVDLLDDTGARFAADNVVAALNEIDADLGELLDLSGELGADTPLTVPQTFVEAINNIMTLIGSGDLAADLDTDFDSKASIVAAMNSLMHDLGDLDAAIAAMDGVEIGEALVNLKAEVGDVNGSLTAQFAPATVSCLAALNEIALCLMGTSSRLDNVENLLSSGFDNTNTVDIIKALNEIDTAIGSGEMTGMTGLSSPFSTSTITAALNEIATGLGFTEITGATGEHTAFADANTTLLEHINELAAHIDPAANGLATLTSQNANFAGGTTVIALLNEIATSLGATELTGFTGRHSSFGAGVDVLTLLGELATAIGATALGSIGSELDTTATTIVAAIDELHTEIGDDVTSILAGSSDFAATDLLEAVIENKNDFLNQTIDDIAFPFRDDGDFDAFEGGSHLNSIHASQTGFAHYIMHSGSAMPIEGFEITVNAGAGTVDIAEGWAVLRDINHVHTSRLEEYYFPAQAGIAMTDNITNFLFATRETTSAVVGPVDTLSFVNSTSTIADSGGGISGIVPGDFIHVGGTHDNEGWYTVATITGLPNSFTVNETLVDEVEGEHPALTIFEGNQTPFIDVKPSPLFAEAGFIATPIWFVTRRGTDFNVVKMREYGQDYVRSNSRKDFRTRGYLHVPKNSNGVSGSQIAEAGTRNLTLTKGSFYIASNEIFHYAFDTTVGGTALPNVFTLINSTAATPGATDWNRVADSKQIPITQYDAVGTLTNLTSEYYGVYWVYLILDQVINSTSIESDESKMVVVYDRDEYVTIADANAASLPAYLPPECNPMSSAVLIGKVVFQEGGSGFEEVISPFALGSQIQSVSPVTHNNVAGIDDPAGTIFHRTFQPSYGSIFVDFNTTLQNFETTFSSGTEASDLQLSKIIAHTTNGPSTSDVTCDSVTAKVDATTISFGDGTGVIADSGSGLTGYAVGRQIEVRGSTSNDGTYTITSVASAPASITTDATFTLEAAGADVTVTQGDDITIDNAGDYECTLSLSFSGTGGSETQWAMCINGVSSPAVRLYRKLGSGGDVGAGAVTGIVTLAANDVLDVKAAVDGGTDEITWINGGLTLTRKA